MNMHKCSRLVALLSIAIVGNAKADITLELDQDLVINTQRVVPIIPLDGSTEYQIGSSQIKLQSEHAIICNRIAGYQPLTPLSIRVEDPNGVNKGDDLNNSDLSIMGAQANVSYNFGERTLNIQTENRSKSICLSSEEFDIIYDDDFGDAPTVSSSDLTYTFLNQPAGGYSPGDTVNYQISYENNTGATLLLDFIEYYPYNNNSEAYFQNGGNVFCEILDDDGLSAGSCFISQGVLKDVNLLPNYQIRVTLGRQIAINSQVGSNLQMLLAIFPKVNTIDRGLGTNQSFAGFDMTSLRLPVVAGSR